MCNKDVEGRDQAEVRQRWRESDGFAMATDGKSFDERLKESVRYAGEPVGQLTGGSGEVPNQYSNTLIVQRRSPLFMSMALGFHTQLDYQPVPYPAQREICEQMVKLGLLRHDPVDGSRFMHYVPVQEALRIYVEALCNVPLPVKRWVMP